MRVGACSPASLSSFSYHLLCKPSCRLVIVPELAHPLWEKITSFGFLLKPKRTEHGSKHVRGSHPVLLHCSHSKLVFGASNAGLSVELLQGGQRVGRQPGDIVAITVAHDRHTGTGQKGATGHKGATGWIFEPPGS